MFQAQTWEVDLGKALDLRPSERLERRSGLFRLAGGGGLVRLDRVYRLGGVRPAVAAKTSAQGAPASAPALAAADDPTGPLDAGGGELVWANAMVADHLMVQVENGVTRERLAASLPALAHVGKQVTAGGLYLVEVPTEGERSVERAVLALNQIKGVVKFAEPDFVLTSADTTTNDPLFTANAADLSKQWHLAKIRAPRAWDVLTGPPFPPAHPQYQPRLAQTVVAVVDTGIDYTHPDLAPNMWTNPGETGGGKETNNIDDDGNGKIDDWRGYDFIDNDNNPMDDVGHGTHVAGIIGAVGNNATGGSGVCWNVKLLNLRIIKAQGTGTYGTYSAAIAALDYIRVLNTTGRKVAVANHSWGGNGYSLAMLNVVNNPLATSDPLPMGITSTFIKDVNTLTAAGTVGEVAKIKVGMSISGAGIPAGTLVTIVSGSTITLSDYTKAAGAGAVLTLSNPIRPKPYGVIHVAAAGNSRFNSDRVPVYPACLPSGFMVSVGATDSTDAVALWSSSAGSNYGRLNVDLFAPGSGIWSAKWKAPGESDYGYESRNGTSMAAPQVAGALALVRMWQPNLAELQARQVLIEQVDQVTALQSKCVSGGRLSIAKIIDRLYQPMLVASGGGTGGGGEVGEALSGAVALTGQIAVARFGYNIHMLAIRQGSVWGWGSSAQGVLGGSYNAGSYGNTETASYKPVQIPLINDAMMVAAAYTRSWVLRSDGTVWTWGGGNPTPQPITGLTDVASMVAGYVVKTDGTVWRISSAETAPQQVIGLEGMVMVADGNSHALALKDDGTVWAWGNRQNGKIGDGGPSTGYQDVPVHVPGLSDVRYIAAGNSDSYAVLSDGTVMYWGQPYGFGARNSPVLFPGLSEVVCVSAGGAFGMAVTLSGTVFTWGNGYSGELGIRSEGFAPTPAQVPILAGNTPVFCAAGGGYGSYGSAMIVTQDGNLLVWGNNYMGCLGQSTGSICALPSLIAPAGSFTEIFAGDGSAYARNAAQEFFAWGTIWGGGSSQTSTFGQTPSRMRGFPELRKAAARTFVRVGITGDGQVYTWGAYALGRIGPSQANVPGKVFALEGAVDCAAGGGAHGISDPSHFALVALADGSVWAWGSNAIGQLGDGTANDHSLPAQITALSNVVRIVAGEYHGMALKADGTLWTWGGNNWGQLGDGTNVNRLLPVQVSSLSNIVDIATQGFLSFALLADGTVWRWGSGSGNLPQQIAGLPPVTSISSSGNLFVCNDSRVWSISFGPIDPNYPRENTGVPGPIIGLSGVTRVAEAEWAAFALKSDGSLWGWGREFGSGILGTGVAWSNEPLFVLGLGGTATTLSTLGTGSTTDSWQLANFSLSELLNDSLVSDSATPAGDGIPNLVKYALGLNPRERSDASLLPAARIDLIGSAAQSAGAEGGIRLFSVPTADLTSGKRYMAFSVLRNGIHLDVDYVVEVSADLQNWMSGDPFTITVLDTAEMLEVYDATAMEDAPQRFMRLRIQRK